MTIEHAAPIGHSFPRLNVPQGACRSTPFVPGGTKKISVTNGRLQVGGHDYRGVFVNAYDQFIDYLGGGNAYVKDLPDIAAQGVKFIRVSLGPLNASDWVLRVGTSGTAPAPGFLTKVRAFLDAAQLNDLGVVFVLYWAFAEVPAALGRTVVDYQTPGSVTRTYMRDLASTIAFHFKNHPALAAYQVGNEWFDHASIADFATVPVNVPNTTIDHFAALVGVQDDVVAGIRRWDVDRSVWTASGTNSRFDSGNVLLFLRKLVAAAGNCDVIDHHYYPDTDRAGFSHVGAGRAPDMGSGGAFFLPMLRAACLQRGKVLVVGEVGGEDDNPNHGSPVFGALSRLCWQQAVDAGVELVGDWGYYATEADAALASNLKTVRRATLEMMAPFNAAQGWGALAPPAAYALPGLAPVTTLCARGTGTAGSWIRIPAHADLSLDLVAGARMVWMFWMRRRRVLGSSDRIFSNNDGSDGYLLTTSGNEGFSMQISFGGFTTYTPDGNFFAYPDIPPDPTIGVPGEWQHVVCAWDGTPTLTPQDDGLQHFTLSINGFQLYRQGVSGRVSTGVSPNPLYLLSQADGLANWAAIDIFDFMMGKNFVLSSQALADYLRTGKVPTGIQHRWKLHGDGQDSVGGLHATVGPAVTFVSNGLGRL